MLTFTVFLVLATGLLAYANGANDNFKGVASLFGSRSANYRTALVWATVTTAAGSVASIFLAQELLTTFSGRGVVPDAVVASSPFLVAIGLGAALTVMLATLTGFPVSTTHALTGAILGTGLMATGSSVNTGVLASAFFLPLLLSPLVAIGLAGSLYGTLRFLRTRYGITKAWCVCVGAPAQFVPAAQSVAMAFEARAGLPVVAAGEQTYCEQRYVGTFLGVQLHGLVNAAHFASGGIVSFARGLNDTPKIASLLLAAQAFDARSGALAVGVAMAVGGLLNARKVAETMSHKITALGHGQGFTANLSTGLLVVLASRYGLPVSTTHVAVGSLFGAGQVTRSASLRVMSAIAASWVLTLPCGAVLGGLVYWLLVTVD
jgi:PiT family inorganic phosphate transporter